MINGSIKTIAKASAKGITEMAVTKKNVEKILQNKKIDLTTLKETWFHHKLIFKLFNNHLEKINKKKFKNCPIS